MKRTETPFRILVLDDDEKILSMFRLFLRQDTRVKIETAVNGREGLHMMMSRFYHLVIVDIQMPVMDGLAFTEEIRRLWPSQPVIFCTGFPSENVRKRALELGVKRILEKPLSINTLQMELDELIEQLPSASGGNADFVQPGILLEALDDVQQAARAIWKHPTAEQWLQQSMHLLRRWVPWQAAAILVQQDRTRLLRMECRQPVVKSEFLRFQELLQTRLGLMLDQSVPLEPHQIRWQPKEPGLATLNLNQIVFIPLQGRYAVEGLVALLPEPDRALDPVHRPILYHLVTQISTLLQAVNHAEELGMTDFLTGLFNRRYLHTALQQHWLLSQRAKSPLAALMVDVDKFKSINDRFGHAVGDQALKRIAQALQETLRRSDTLIRVGGDEFLILLPQTTQEGVISLSKRLQQHIQSLQVSPPELEIKLSASMGAAVSLPSELICSPSQLVEFADQALRSAKQKGDLQLGIWSPAIVNAERPGPHPVLLVDDDPQIIHLVKRMLPADTYAITGVTSVADAEALLAEGRRFDLLLTDLALPGKDGIAMLRIAREMDPLMIRLVITGHASRHTEETLGPQGVFSVVPKPFHPNSLRTLLQKALEQRTNLIRSAR